MKPEQKRFEFYDRTSIVLKQLESKFHKQNLEEIRKRKTREIFKSQKGFKLNHIYKNICNYN